MADRTEPDDLDRRIERARHKMDAGRSELMAAIHEALAIGRGPSRIGRYAHWSRDYVAKIVTARLTDIQPGTQQGRSLRQEIPAPPDAPVTP